MKKLLILLIMTISSINLISCINAVDFLPGLSGGVIPWDDLDLQRSNFVTMEVVESDRRECARKYRDTTNVDLCMYEKGYQSKLSPGAPCDETTNDPACKYWLKTGKISDDVYK